MPRVNRVSRMVKLKPFAAATMGGAFCEYEGLVTLKENWYRTKSFERLDDMQYQRLMQPHAIPLLAIALARKESVTGSKCST